MTTDELIKVVATTGFPIAVASYLLIRLETTLRELIAAVNRMRRAILLSLPRDSASAVEDQDDAS